MKENNSVDVDENNSSHEHQHIEYINYQTKSISTLSDAIQDFDVLSQKKLETIKKRNLAVTILVLLTVICILLSHIMLEYNNREYIGGNILNIAYTDIILNEPPSLLVESPWRNASLTASLLFRTLFKTDSTFTEINSSIASSLDISDDGLTYTIKLNTDDKWSDGEPITVDDVVFSIETFVQLTDVNSNISAAFNNILGVDDFKNGNTDTILGIETSSNTIIITLKQRYNNFGLMLTQFTPLPMHILKDIPLNIINNENLNGFYSNPVCSGMYIYDSRDEDMNFILTLNSYFSDKTSQIEKIILHWDWNKVDIDYYSTTDITQIVSYNSMRGYKEYPVNVYFYRYFIFNIEDNEAMDNLLLRQAISHALDQGALLSDIYYNTGELLFSGSSSDLSGDAYPYNPTLARTLLDQSGYNLSRPFKICYYYSDSTTFIFLERVKEYLEDIGLNVELITADTRDDGKISTDFLYVDREYDMLLKGLSSFDTEDWYNEYLSTNSTVSALFGTNNELDTLAKELSSATFKDEYDEALQNIIELEQELIYKIPLFTLSQMVYINENRVTLPSNITFGNVKYFSDLRFSEWHIKKQ